MKFDEFGKPIVETEVPEFGQSIQAEGYTEGETDTVEDGVVDLSTKTEMVGRVGKIGKEQVLKAQEILQKYKDAKANLESRIVENERWYKGRHWEVVAAQQKGHQNDPRPTSAWLFNSLANKHADFMDNYPEPNVLPREEGDKPHAKKLSEIMPVILERNEFEQTYNDAAWYKLKQGTCCYGVFWNNKLENGLGDIDIKQIDLLNIFFEPGIKDIQKSRNVFTVELVDKDLLEGQYPFLEGKLASNAFDVTQYIHDENIDVSDKCAVVDWYYKAWDGSREVLHYCKFVGDEVLYASENDFGDEETKRPNYAQRGFYDHAMYPFVFDTLFTIEDSPCGFGYVDIMKDPQMYIDKLNQIIIKNAFMAGKKRWFVKQTSAINLEQFADWEKDFVEVVGALNEENLREFTVNPLPNFIVDHLQMKIDELKETSGNRDFSQGGTSSGVTAASAIAALQEAGSKLSRDMIKTSYRAFQQINYIVLELIRQFYDEVRSFRITGENGADQYVQFDNSSIREQPVIDPATGETDFRRPIFDIKITSQKQSPFNKIAQNELAKELYQMGAFNPQMTDQSLLMLEMMDFEQKDMIIQKVQQNGTLLQMVQNLTQVAMKLSTIVDQQNGTNTTAEVASILGVAQPGMAQPVPSGEGVEGSPMTETTSNESTTMSKARLAANQRSAVR